MRTSPGFRPRVPFLALVFAVALLETPVRSGEVNDAGKAARDILEATGVQGGLVVHLGCGDGALTAALLADDRYLVQGLDTDPEEIAAARDHIRSLGLYGRVSVSLLEGTRLPYADNLVNLVVVDESAGVAREEIRRVLAPGGVACIRADGEWIRSVKPRPDDIDDWTHYYHGPDNNAVAQDRRVGPPQHLQWVSPPRWCRSHDGVPSSIALVLSAGGRLFSVIDEGLTGQPGLPQRWVLVARDAFNGVLLWKRPLRRRPPQRGVVALDRSVYLLGGTENLLTAIDASTGEEIRTYGGTRAAGELVCADGVAALRLRGPRRSSDRRDDSILALELETGRYLWKKEAGPAVGESLAVADGRLCCLDGDELVCVDLHSGDERWRSDCGMKGQNGVLMIYRGAVLVPASGGLRAYSAATGELLWKGRGVHRRLGMFGAGGLVWLTDIQERGRTFLWTPEPVVSAGYDPLTGEVRRTVTVPRLITPGHHIRCYSAKATERYLLLPKRGVEFVDLVGENHMRHDWLRAPCGHGITVANGILYAPPHQCFCYPGVKLAGFNALTSGRVEQQPPAEYLPRFERGPAWDRGTSDVGGKTAASDWPVYRHDALRSGAAGCEVPARLERLWQRDLGGRLSQPVLAKGRLLVAEEEAHAIRCLDAETGETRWLHTADGRIDSAPSFCGDLILFGSTAGYVTCLRAEDGKRVWRFRAAPGERRIVVHGQVESAWPVHGSVMVHKGLAYVTAGRSSFLDGGIWVYALDPATGEVRHSAHLLTPRPDVTTTAGRPFDMEGARTDLLVSDGTDLYMFFTRFAPDLSQRPAPRITKLGDRDVGLHLISNAGFLDREWFDRSYWTYSRRWPGYYFGYDAPKTGQILVFDEENTYGLHVFNTRQGHSPRFWPGKEGYELFADSNGNQLVLRPTAVGREKGPGFSRALPPRWSVRVPIRARAMVLAGEHLFFAGPPDVVPEDDPYAAIEGRKGGRLRVVSTEDGRRLAEYELEHPPVFDGLIAAGGRLYVATIDGRLICMGSKE